MLRVQASRATSVVMLRRRSARRHALVWAWLAPVALACAGCLGPGTLNEDRCSDDVEALFAKQCNTCHSSALEGEARSEAPDGVNYDTEGDIQRQVAEIREQVEQDLMPPTRALPGCDKTLLF